MKAPRFPRPWRAACLVLAIAAVDGGPAALAGTAPPAPREFEVTDGEDVWHPKRRFKLQWEKAAGGGLSIAAVRYLVRHPDGTIAVGPGRLGWAATVLDVDVPAIPAAYTAEVRLEDTSGAVGPAAVGKLRFDDQRPGGVEPLAPGGWIGRAEFPLTVRLVGPAGTAPVSGIRGYAVSVDRTPGAGPCAAGGRCEEAETTLSGGSAGNALALAGLPEGTSYLHAVAVSGAGLRSATPGRTVLRVDTTDPVTRLAGVPEGWSNGPVRLIATATDSGSGMAAAAGRRPFTAIRVGAQAPVVGYGDSVATTLFAEGAHAVAHYARDAAGNVNDGARSNGVANRQPAIATVRIDRSPPSAAFAAQDPRDPELIRVRIRDPLSGPDPQRGWIGVRPAGSAGRFAPLPAAPPGPGELRARWDSGAHPPGRYELRATVYDAAGNAAVAGNRESGAPLVLSAPLKATTTLWAGFGGQVMTWHRCARRGERRSCRRQTIAAFGRRPASRTVPYGRGVRFSGRLLAGRSMALGGTPVRIVERFAAGTGAATRVTTARTDAGGGFSARLPAGPSRSIEARFDGDRALGRSAAAAVRLGVRSGVRMRASSRSARVGGRPLVFTGRVAAKPGEIPADGVTVQLQFRLTGLPWSEFRTIQTDRRGRFRYPYRFANRDSRGARFQFRAHAPKQGGWPYEPGSSRPVAVLGR